jgi:K+-transporting ATPase KdpF subunit
MLKLIALVVIVALGAFLIYAATRPDSFRVQRSATIKAPPEKIFSLINDLRSMQTWSAWEKMDPGMKRTYSGAASGPGAAYAWAGNRQIGEGRMEIIESSPPSKITLRMDFFKPFAAVNTLEFTLQPDGEATRVTEAFFGPSPFLSKVMGILCNMDKMVGGKFDESLAELKAIAER